MAGSPEPIFEEIEAEHRLTVLRICRSILRDEHLGADAAQETFLRLWSRLDQGRAPQRFGAWLRRVAVSTSLDLARRRRSRDAAAEARLRDAGAADVEERARPEDLVARAELDQLFEAALATLSEGQRAVFLLRHSAGLPLRQVAEVLGVATPTVKTQFARACTKLQAALSTFRPTEDR